jgi:hypothetical protein
VVQNPLHSWLEPVVNAVATGQLEAAHWREVDIVQVFLGVGLAGLDDVEVGEFQQVRENTFFVLVGDVRPLPGEKKKSLIISRDNRPQNIFTHIFGHVRFEPLDQRQGIVYR